MQGLIEFITEDKNTHLEHLEDEIINNGSKGAKTSIEFLKSIKKMLQGGKGGSNVSVNGTGHLLYLQVQIQRTVGSLWVPNPYLTQRLK